MSDKKPLTKMEWMLRELNKDGLYPTESAVNRILEGDTLEFFDDAMVDSIMDVNDEWDSRK